MVPIILLALVTLHGKERLGVQVPRGGEVRYSSEVVGRVVQSCEFDFWAGVAMASHLGAYEVPR